MISIPLHQEVSGLSYLPGHIPVSPTYGILSRICILLLFENCINLTLIMLNWFIVLFRYTVSFSSLYTHSINFWEHDIESQLNILIYLLKKKFLLQRVCWTQDQSWICLHPCHLSHREIPLKRIIVIYSRTICSFVWHFPSLLWICYHTFII